VNESQEGPPFPEKPSNMSEAEYLTATTLMTLRGRGPIPEAQRYEALRWYNEVQRWRKRFVMFLLIAGAMLLFLFLTPPGRTIVRYLLSVPYEWEPQPDVVW